MSSAGSGPSTSPSWRIPEAVVCRALYYYRAELNRTEPDLLLPAGGDSITATDWR